MTTIPFDINKVSTHQVVDTKGNPIRILCVDNDDIWKVVGASIGGDVYRWTRKGWFYYDRESELDLRMVAPSKASDEVERAFIDKRRMDWLVGKHVEVRKPLAFGSREMFTSRDVAFEDEPYRSDLRNQIDEAMAREAKESKHEA